MRRLLTLTAALPAAAALLLTGCDARDADPAATPVAAVDADDHAGHDHPPGEHPSGDHDHSGWWCPEHGVPEGECALCDTSLVADYKAEGDWCELHDRPQSQCFLCDPSKFDRYKAMYVARFGENPPEPTE